MRLMKSEEYRDMNVKILGSIALFFIAFGVAAAQLTPGELLIRLTPDAARLQANAPISGLHAEHKVESLQPLFPYLARPALNPNLRRTYLLRFAPDIDLETIKAVYAESPLVEAVAFNYLRPTLQETRRREGEVVNPNDPRFAEQWNLPLTRLPQAWAIEKGNANVVIAIIDSGIDYRHDDLAAKTWVNPGEVPDNGLDDDGNGYVDDVHGWDFTDAPNVQGEGDFIEGDNEPIDESGHGTHVAGIAGAMADNGIGIAGVAWHCPLMAIRAGLSLGGSSRMQDDDSAAAIVYAADNGASVINMSWGSEQVSFVIQDAIDYAHARGVVLVGAAGNSQKAAAIFPAAYRQVIAVASTEQHQQRFYQSNFGASVDIAAPGNVILSTQIDNQYRLLTGTSMAAPHVAGVAALMLSKRPALTHEEVRQILINTADVVPQEESVTPDPRFVGAGTLNAERALLASGALQARILSPETNSGGSNAIHIIGTAGGYQFESWQLLYAQSTVPDTFTPFTEPSSQQKIEETLAVWNTAAMPEGIYTVRLQVTGKEGSVQTQDQVVVTVDRTPPRVTSLTATETLYGNRSITIFTWATDDVTRNTLYYRRKNQLAPFASVEENELGKEHFISLGLPNGTYQFFVEARNAIGLTVTENNQGQYWPLDVVGSAISPNGFDDLSIGVPPLHIASVTADFDGDGALEIVGKPLQGTGIAIYERNQTGKYQERERQDIALHTGEEAFTPWTVNDTDNDGLLEILVSDSDRTFLLESTAPNGYPENLIWESPFLTGGSIADLDADGRLEIIGADNRNDRILIYENRGDNLYEEIAQLVNETEGANVFGHHFAIADFDADGNLELVAGDSEGELFVYSAFANDRFRLEWQMQLDMTGETLQETDTRSTFVPPNPVARGPVPRDALVSRGIEVTLLTAGDLTGDGIPEFVVGGTQEFAGVPSAAPLWKFFVFTQARGAAPSEAANGYAPLWEQAIVPYRRIGNGLRIADVTGDGNKELVILTHPNLYVMTWDGTTFVPPNPVARGPVPRDAFAPMWSTQVSETPALFTADLDDNGFDEIYVNSDDELLRFESAFAKNRQSVETLTPWELSATPLTAKAVQVTWIAPAATGLTSFTVYRAMGEKGKTPDDTEFKPIAEELTTPRFLDRRVTTDKTHWYAITAKDENGEETERTAAVSATPRQPPKLISAQLHVPGTASLEPVPHDTAVSERRWVILTFDRRMGFAIGDESRYLLREPQRIGGVRPVSAIRDRMGTRALLAFEPQHFQHADYEITVSNVADSDDNPLRTATQPLQIPQSLGTTAVTDFTQARVYPNPVYPNLSDKGAITFDKVPIGTRIQIFAPTGHLIEDFSAHNENRSQWWLTSKGGADVSSGIYIYVLEFENLKKVGKIAVVK